MDPIFSQLDRHGPSRSSSLAQALISEFGITPEAARKRLSRVRPPIVAFPVPLLPKGEKFLYRLEDRKTERFWTNFHNALRETESVYGAAIDGLIARGGIVATDEFPVISGAPIKQQRQVPAALVLKRLQAAGIVRKLTLQNIGDAVFLDRSELGYDDTEGFRARQLAEGVMLDAVREWAKRLGMASYRSIVIRGDEHLRMVGPYKWDLTGPSYLMPLKGRKDDMERQGFLVADAFVNESLDHHQIRYFIRKAQGLRATTKVGSILPLIVAQGFTPEALTRGHRAGLMMATPRTLFGGRAARSFANLVDTLRNAAAIVAGNPNRLIDLLENLSEIEGAAGNLRGVLFELIVAYLVRDDGTSIDIGRKAYDSEKGQYADIDLLRVRGRAECVFYECKGKNPGGKVTKEEVDEWLRRLPIFKAYARAQPSLSEARVSFELWTSGDFELDALEKLKYEKPRRTKTPIDWKSGEQVRAVSTNLKEKKITSAFDEHFFRHPLS